MSTPHEGPRAGAAPSVLIVDDSELNLELARFVLESDGFEVRTALGGDPAWLEIERDPPQLILMDVQMPQLDGLTLTRRIKADPALRGIVVVAFTAYAMKGDESRLRAAGCDGYLSKPIDVATFAASVRALMPPTSTA